VKEVKANIYQVDLKKEEKQIEPSIINLIQEINGL